MRSRVLCLIAAVCTLASVSTRAGAASPHAVPEPPVLHSEVRTGRISAVPGTARTPAVHTVDGQIGDWIGTPTRLAGAAAFSAGEYIYSDHLFDAHGPEDGDDTNRVTLLDLLARVLPESYRVDPVGQIDPFDELGVPLEYPLRTGEEYGDAGFTPASDIEEVRVAATATDVYLLVRTTTMTAPNQTGILVLADTTPGAATRQIPFGANITSTRADVAALIVGTTATIVNLRTGATTAATAATNATGYDNAIEARFPLAALVGVDKKLTLAIAAGPAAGPKALAPLAGLPTGAHLANVAFRPGEPVRTFFDKQQSIALGARTIDPFFASIDPALSRGGVDDRIGLMPGGYYERVFTSTASISTEGGNDGIFQHYGLYVPLDYRKDTPQPATFWMHWRGGKAHSGATVSPRIMRDQGDGHGGFVFAPRGRGTSTWYLGEGMVDFNEVWSDAMSSFRVDADRVYVSGHSMGGWASWLLSVLYPDRFAGAFPVEGPVTEGAWTGLDFPGCDGYFLEQAPEYTPCYIGTNDGVPRTQHTLRLIDNLRNVPIAIYQGLIDELVPVSGVTLQVDHLRELGYRYRYYLFPTYEHYTHPIVDEWAEGVRYLDAQRRVANPAHVTYVRDMPFEATVETGPSAKNPTRGLNFDFDHAYWMSQLTPVDPIRGVARFDGQSRAIPAPARLTLPEAGGPTSLGQAGPYAMVGQQWLRDPLAAPPVVNNAFDITLTGASRVALDLARMAIQSTRTITGRVAADHALELRLIGAWATAPVVKVNGAVVASSLVDGALRFVVPAGAATVAVA